MNFNFFDWIRMGVRDSVLHGVNDAANAMGMPSEEPSRGKILSFLQENTQGASQRRLPSPAASTSGQRKLGRGLTEK